jgi:hypothetical protein
MCGKTPIKEHNMKLRIVELTRPDDSVIYVLEREDAANEYGWSSVWRHTDLEEVRAAKAKRENPSAGIKMRVIED